MRRRLILVFLAISTLVATAFVVPLGFLVRRTAEDRSVDAARADAAAIVPALVTSGTRGQVEAALESTASGRADRITVITSQGWTIGAVIDPSDRVEEALRAGVSDIGPVDGGVEVVAAVASGPEDMSAVRVFVPNNELREGQWRAWGALAGVGIALVAISVFVADRLALTVVRPTEALATAARSLGDGDLDVKVYPSGPDELVELGSAFNDLGDRVSAMLALERELVAELSHRLRTPLTALRMRADQVTEPALADSLRGDIASVTAVVNELIQEARGAIAGSDSCNLAEVFTDRAEFWSALAEDQGRPWRFKRGESNLPIAVSPIAFEAAIDVLFENVFSHTDEGCPVDVGFDLQEGRAHAWVSDGGSGIDVGNVLAGSSTAGSTGLGLGIARRTIEEAGGQIAVGESNLGGAKIELSLPLLRRSSNN